MAEIEAILLMDDEDLEETEIEGSCYGIGKADLYEWASQDLCENYATDTFLIALNSTDPKNYEKVSKIQEEVKKNIPDCYTEKEKEEIKKLLDENFNSYKKSLTRENT